MQELRTTSKTTIGYMESSGGCVLLHTVFAPHPLSQITYVIKFPDNGKQF